MHKEPRLVYCMTTWSAVLCQTDSGIQFVLICSLCCIGTFFFVWGAGSRIVGGKLLEQRKMHWYFSQNVVKTSWGGISKTQDWRVDYTVSGQRKWIVYLAIYKLHILFEFMESDSVARRKINEVLKTCQNNWTWMNLCQMVTKYINNNQKWSKTRSDRVFFK